MRGVDSTSDRERGELCMHMGIAQTLEYKYTSGTAYMICQMAGL